MSLEGVLLTVSHNYHDFKESLELNMSLSPCTHTKISASEATLVCKCCATALQKNNLNMY